MDRPRLFIDDYCTLEEHYTNPIKGENFVQLQEMGGGRIISDLIKEHPVAGKAFVDDKFARYRSGVYRAPNAIRKKLSLHALLIIGENRTKSGVQVYDCQNSWGEDGGDEGFCKVEKLCLLKFCYAINPRVQGIPPPPNPLQVYTRRPKGPLAPPQPTASSSPPLGDSSSTDPNSLPLALCKGIVVKVDSIK